MRVETAVEQVLFLTFRIRTEQSVGTGFVVNHRWKSVYKDTTGRMVDGHFLVTNKHVIRDSTSGRITLARRRHDDPEVLLGHHGTIEIRPEHWQHWMHHPSDDVDVAALPLEPVIDGIEPNPETAFYFTNLPSRDFPDRHTMANLDAVEEIAFAGYPNNIYDSANNLPIIRRGITATPVYVDYDGQPVFLIDASVFPGSSGSPVFIYSTSPWIDRSGDTRIGGRRFIFLGILSSAFFRQEDGRLEFAKIPASLLPVVKTRQMIDLGVVFKASTIVETLEHGLRATGHMQAETSE